MLFKYAKILGRNFKCSDSSKNKTALTLSLGDIQYIQYRDIYVYHDTVLPECPNRQYYHQGGARHFLLL